MHRGTGYCHPHVPQQRGSWRCMLSKSSTVPCWDVQQSRPLACVVLGDGCGSDSGSGSGYHVFARHGIPETVICDNGPQYSADLYATFARKYGFEHVTSSPLYSQGNGEPERAVKIIKGLLCKLGDPYLAPVRRHFLLKVTPAVSCRRKTANSCWSCFSDFPWTRISSIRHAHQ